MGCRGNALVMRSAKRRRFRAGAAAFSNYASGVIPMTRDDRSYLLLARSEFKEPAVYVSGQCPLTVMMVAG